MTIARVIVLRERYIVLQPFANPETSFRGRKAPLLLLATPPATKRGLMVAWWVRAGQGRLDLTVMARALT